MVDTTTTILGLLLQETGGNANAWGANLNNEVIQPLEDAVKGGVTISGLTGGAYSLTQASAAYGTIILTGTLASDLVITAPSTYNNWRFINNLTHAGFYATIKTSGNTAVNIPHGKVTEITCDGTNMYRHDRESVGELFYHGGTTAPGGTLECNGATPLRLSAVDLFAEIGTTWGVGDNSTTFTIPDAYTAGKFLRSRTASVTAGTSQTDQNKAHTHTGSGTTSTQSADHSHTFSGNTGAMSANASHTHSTTARAASTSTTGGGAFAIGDTTPGSIGSTSTEHTHAYSGTTSGVSGNHTHTYSFTTSSDGGTEARPTNLSAMLCIRY
jgi:hypothetical protein